MSNKKPNQELRALKYRENQKMYDLSMVKVLGTLQAIIDDIELANEVVPEVITNNLKYVVNDVLDGIHKGNNDKEVAEQHNAIALKVNNAINNCFRDEEK